MATGSGKTRVAARSTEELRASRVLVPVPLLDLVDVNRHVLGAAPTALEPVRGSCSVSVFTGGAHVFTPAVPGRAPTLITRCRSFHRMARPGVLDMADRTAAPHAVLAIRGDGSLRTHVSDWTIALRGLIQTCLGEGASRGHSRHVHRPRPLLRGRPRRLGVQ
ncbi:hypothetical protein [Streptomyces sp. NPDC001744]|uniref:hypothetical protein n=1 Tax=Streptomyces sp. NPDC001744 TaxID=3364606 RepID=UPI0036AD97DA